MEKAWAKTLGTYESIARGSVTGSTLESFSALLGAPVVVTEVSEYYEEYYDDSEDGCDDEDDGCEDDYEYDEDDDSQTIIDLFNLIKEYYL